MASGSIAVPSRALLTKARLKGQGGQAAPLQERSASAAAQVRLVPSAAQAILYLHHFTLAPWASQVRPISPQPLPSLFSFFFSFLPFLSFLLAARCLPFLRLGFRPLQVVSLSFRCT